MQRNEKGPIDSTRGDGYYFPNRGNGPRVGRGAFAGQERDNRYFYGPFPDREMAQTFSAFHHDSSIRTAKVEQYTEVEIDAIMDDPRGDNLVYRWNHPCQADYSGLTYEAVKKYWQDTLAQRERDQQEGYPNVPAV